MSRTVGILFVTWLCIFSVSEAEFGASCSVDGSTNCTATSESCIEGSCKCSNGYSYIDNECKSSAITVSLSPSSNSVLYGSEVTLTATVSSDVPVSTIIWQKVSGDSTTSNLDTNLDKYDQTGDVGTGTVKLTIKGLVNEDKGNYQIEVTNNAGTKETSNQVSIDVTGGTISIVLSLSSNSVLYGSEVTLTASITSDVPVSTIIWQKVSGETTSNLDTNLDKYDQTGDVGTGTVKLTIKGLVIEDKGNYQVEITNNAGTKETSNQMSIDVTGGTITVSLSTISSSVLYGSEVTLTATVSSDVTVSTIVWQKVSGDSTTSNLDTNLAKYNQTGDVGTDTVKLTIKGLNFQDKGNYQVEITNNAGTKATSNQVSIDVTGALTVITGADITGRIGGSVTIDCNVTGPEVSNIQWIKYTNNNPSNIVINNNTYFGGLVTSAALTIIKLVETDAAQYQCTASNPGGVYNSVNRATVTVKYGQFNESCTSIEQCDPSKYLECSSSNKCLCNSTYYHKDKECFPKSGMAPTIKELITTTDHFSVSWDNPSTHNELVSAYEVTWRVASSSAGSSGLLSRTKSQYTSPSNLTSGQLYLVNVNSHADLTEPTQSIVVTSGDRNMRIVPLAPGLIIRDESNFSHNNLKIKWTAPVDTVVTKYEITLNGTTYYAMDDDPIYQFNGKVFIPGESYEISIVTVSGTTLDIVKKSSEHTEWIRTTPTKPNPPTNLQCPQSPLDISLEISWTAPTEPNGLILKYQIDVSPGNLQMNTSSNNTHKNVEGLSPEKMYNFTVRTVNDAIDSTSEPSQPKTCKTKAGVSTAPTNLEINEVQSRGFKIEFNKPDNVSGILAAYKIVIYQGGTCVQQILIPGMCSNCNSTFGCPLPINYSVPDITNNDVSYTASGLMPYTNYMVKVVAINGEGDGRPANKTVNTDEEVPRQPEQITASIIENSSLRLTWTYPDQSPGNTTYTIYTYEGTDDLGTHFLMNKSTKVNGFDTKTLLVKGLDEYWLYKFKVNAATVKGNTTSEFSSVFRTKQGEPGQVLNFTVQRKGNDFRTAYVSWSPPALRDHNGVLQSYLFSSNHTGAKKVVQIPVLPTQATVERNISVTPETVYDIEVVLQNNESTKSQPSMQIYRAPAGPPPVTNIDPLATKPGEHKSTTKTITIEINTTYFKNNDNGKQVFVGVAVCAESKCKDKKGMPESTLLHDWKDLPNWHVASKDGFPLYRVTNDTFKDKVINGSRRRRSVNSGSTTELVIGEDITCPSLNKDVYCNGQLSAGKSYNVIIFACTSGGCTYSEVDGAFSTQKVPDEEDNAMKIIIGVVGAVVVVAVIVGVAFVVVRRRNRLGETKQYTKGLDNQTTFDEPVPKNIPRKRPIKLKELCDKVAEKHKDSNLHFAREYEDLKALSPKHPAETSELDNNKLKNRYVNILPFDHSRVKLMLTEDDDPSTDFINANYLPGYKSQREYIATQGPIPGTIDDFWRMIWEQNVSIIVMLTLCKEEGRVKCEMYWPENIHEPKQYGDLVVETVSNSTVNFYEFRIFKIKLGDTTRSVKHFHFLQWKDFSANVQNDVMIDFIKNVRNHIRPPDMNGPVVVHCSAGVGRTGTYCSLDHLFQFVDEHDLDESIDIFDLVMNLRERRMFMVQTEQQYVFIHDCVRDYVERKKKELQGNLLYENVNRGFVADDEPVEESLYQNYSNQRTDL